MSWACSLSRQAAKQLRGLPRERRAQLAQAINDMERDPTSGDVRPIKSGKLKGALRKRVGPCRIVYSVDPSSEQVDIAAILTRSGTTYR
ncbi:MAG: type II toxin-antitoxin system RelE/ParE family toxin [Candidatus Bipolaricaulota bacterium]|nr:type II toxin-antitoxin system RelE/ParE family toxin [Candidatus Bipolaricaulota bacterium]